MKYGIYTLSQSVCVIYTSNKYPRIDNVMNVYLWHCRLDHINKNRINRLTKEKIFNINNCESLSICESYLLGKMTKSPLTEKGERASDVLGPVHSDICGPMNISIKGGFYYFIIFTDDLSRYGYIYLMKHKFELFKIFK